MPGLCEDMWNKVGVDWHVTLPSLPVTLKPFIFHLYPERVGSGGGGVVAGGILVGILRGGVPHMHIIT